jgi:hypothetical protein
MITLTREDSFRMLQYLRPSRLFFHMQIGAFPHYKRKQV